MYTPTTARRHHSVSQMCGAVMKTLAGIYRGPLTCEHCADHSRHLLPPSPQAASFTPRGQSLSMYLLSTYSEPFSEARGNKKSVATVPRDSQASGNSQVLVTWCNESSSRGHRESWEPASWGEQEAGSGNEQAGVLEVWRRVGAGSKLGKMCTGPGPVGKRPQINSDQETSQRELGLPCTSWDMVSESCQRL